MSNIQLGWILSSGKIAIVLIVAVVAVKVLHRLIARFTDRASRAKKNRRFGHKQTETSRRHEQRAKAVGSVLNSTVTVIVWGLAILLCLSELGLNLGPILASAGVVGVALGFGAQELVRDFMSGIAMIMEDQYGVGDRVQFSIEDDDGIYVVGMIEMVALRITKIRDSEGVIWYVRNGEVQKVGNQSQAAPAAE